ncbi:hypothetical protein AXF42_Ash021341 [Apostasia shenzhenica]|uniref:Uncharacterized protein n=1 Tax=Apostasia shenzhenica TaxID=1088818 RepID=A0A2H9ZYK2_9ASPA|nr:hypothetical protein AXF42_Ash021341 [Apostasia shenzhenica]
MLWVGLCDGNAPSRRMSVSTVASDREIGVGMISGRRGLSSPQPQHTSKVRCAH